AVSANNVWAVGHSNNRVVDAPLIEHWDGTQWSIVPSPNAGLSSTLNAIGAVSAGDIWAAGDYWSGTGIPVRSLLLHWNGSTWGIIAAPNAGTGDNDPTGLAAMAADDVW